MLESFEIISIDGKIVIYYYKEGTLAVEGNEKDLLFSRIIRQVNKFVSKKEHI